MVNFTPVDPATLDTARLGRRGRVSYPIIKAFMESNIKLGKLDMTGFEDKNPQYMRSVLQSYIKNHNLPIKLMAIQGDLHLMRLDLNNDGTPIENWENSTEALRATEGRAGHLRDMEPVPITEGEVDARFAEEKGQKGK